MLIRSMHLHILEQRLHDPVGPQLSLQHLIARVGGGAMLGQPCLHGLAFVSVPVGREHRVNEALARDRALKRREQILQLGRRDARR